jgi:hypothetical protein
MVCVRGNGTRACSCGLGGREGAVIPEISRASLTSSLEKTIFPTILEYGGLGRAAAPMKEKKLKFIRILNAELDDLMEDIELLMGAYKQRCEKGEITNYVFMENQAVFKNEIAYLNEFARLVQRMDLDRFQTMEELCAFVESEFKQNRKKGCYTPSIESVMERKLQKVLLYVKS